MIPAWCYLPLVSSSSWKTQRTLSRNKDILHSVNRNGLPWGDCLNCNERRHYENGKGVSLKESYDGILKGPLYIPERCMKTGNILGDCGLDLPLSYRFLIIYVLDERNTSSCLLGQPSTVSMTKTKKNTSLLLGVFWRRILAQRERNTYRRPFSFLEISLPFQTIFRKLREYK